MKKGKMKKRNVAMLGLGILWVSSVSLIGLWFVNANLDYSWVANKIQSGSIYQKLWNKVNGKKKMMKNFINTDISYTDFVNKIKDTPAEGKITEESFNTMKEKMQKRQNIRAEREAKKEEIKKAVQSHDYETWKSLHNENADIVSKIDSQEKFEKLIEMHSIMEEAKTKADAIREELGIEKGFKKQHWAHWRKIMKNWNKIGGQKNTEK